MYRHVRTSLSLRSFQIPSQTRLYVWWNPNSVVSTNETHCWPGWLWKEGSHKPDILWHCARTRSWYSATQKQDSLTNCCRSDVTPTSVSGTGLKRCCMKTTSGGGLVENTVIYFYPWLNPGRRGFVQTRKKTRLRTSSFFCTLVVSWKLSLLCWTVFPLKGGNLYLLAFVIQRSRPTRSVSFTQRPNNGF